MTEKAPPSPRQLMRQKYHGVILGTIAAQCPLKVPEGAKPWTKATLIAAWKEYMRERFHPGESTEAMSDERFSWLVSTVEAHGATELGVTYPDPPQPEEPQP